jgi:hypothetical protein
MRSTAPEFRMSADKWHTKARIYGIPLMRKQNQSSYGIAMTINLHLTLVNH